MSIGIIIFVILSLIFFGRAMANQDAGHHLWNVVVDVVCLTILVLTGTSVDSADGYAVLFILLLDLTGFGLTKLGV